MLCHAQPRNSEIAVPCFSIALLSIVSVCSLSVRAQVKDFLGIANHLGVNINVGTTGIGFEAATPITPFVQARAGISVMPGIKFHVDSDEDLAPSRWSWPWAVISEGATW